MILCGGEEVRQIILLHIDGDLERKDKHKCRYK